MHGDESSVELHQDGQQIAIKASARLDPTTVGRLRPALIDACADPQQKVILDLSDVRLCNPLTVGALARTARQVRRNECHFIVKGLSRFQTQVQRIGGP
jgi:anti-anti-sigma factor